MDAMRRAESSASSLCSKARPLGAFQQFLDIRIRYRRALNWTLRQVSRTSEEVSPDARARLGPDDLGEVVQERDDVVLWSPRSISSMRATSKVACRAFSQIVKGGFLGMMPSRPSRRRHALDLEPDAEGVCGSQLRPSRDE